MKPQISSRSEIRDAASFLFDSDGIEETAVKDITRKAGIAKGTFYRYFDSKDELVNEIFEETSEELLKVLKTQDGNVKIAPLTRELLTFFDRNRLILSELRKDLAKNCRQPYTEKILQVLSGLVKEFINLDPRFKITEIDIYCDVIISAILDICHRSIVTEAIEDREEALMMMSDFMKKFFDCE